MKYMLQLLLPFSRALACSFFLSFISTFSLQAVSEEGPSLTQFSSNLPLFSIRTHGREIQRDSTIKAEFSFLDNSYGFNSTQDLWNQELMGPSLVEIRRRGNSSDKFPQKQYQIEFLNQRGAGIEQSLLNLPKGEKWVLYAPYIDKTLMRNVLAYKTASKLFASDGRPWYNPRTKFVELFLNGQYEGVYVLIEKIERHENRVNLKKMDFNKPDELSFMMQIAGKGYEVQTKHKTMLEYVYPSKDKLTQDLKGEMIRKRIIKKVEAFEDTLASPFFRDPQRGYPAWIDTQSFINHILIQETFKNIDGFRRSVYFYLAENGRITMGPVWDFNIAMGNVGFYDQTDPEGWNHPNRHYIDGNTAAFWFKRLMSDVHFVEHLVKTYKYYRAPGGPLSTESLFQEIDANHAELQYAQARNFKRWDILGKWVSPIYFNPPPWPKTYEGELLKLKTYMQKRMQWMDESIDELVEEALKEKEKLDKEEAKALGARPRS